jgi:dTDP-4-amino-4,6-dideoxy-D-galactose acyltransferase
MQMQTIYAHGKSALHSLEWDSRHFGFPVCRIDGPTLDEVELEETLRSARRAKVKMVYWSTDHGRAVSQAVLDEFAGLLVDRQVTYQHDLRPPEVEKYVPTTCLIREHPPTQPRPGVLRLAVAAGVCSRFRRDPRIPRNLFERLYEHWIIRSVSRELADVVLIGGIDASNGDPVGLITISLTDGQGSIGLVAVDENVRGKGIGSSLIHAAHSWLFGRGARRTTVVTQLENDEACRLYERRGYQPREFTDRYHFWP